VAERRCFERRSNAARRVPPEPGAASTPYHSGVGSRRDGTSPNHWVYGPVGRAFRSVVQGAFLFPIVRFLTPITVRGREHMRGLESPIIVAANHVSHLDTPVVLRVLPRRIRNQLVVAAAKDYFYRGRLKGALISLSLATFPFDREEGSRDSLAQTRGLLEHGRSLLIFPEGTRSPSGELGRVRSGVAVLAFQVGAPVLPIFVHGLAKVMPKGTAAPLPGGIVVDVAEPIRPGPGEDVAALRDRVEGALRELAAQAPDWGDSGGR
jgi:1-acyl-sn-glycerol-3-phosphate acyltransferase